MPFAGSHVHEVLKAALLIASSWTALGCYASAVTALALEKAVSPLPRRIWTAGCLSYFAHMLLAFDVAYDWSHERAVADIAIQSESLSGVSAPWGLWINYAYGAVWLVDLLGWVRVGETGYRRRSIGVHWLVHGFFLFMLFNGGFVFVERWTRWIGLGLFLVSLWAVCRLSGKLKPWTPLPQKSSS